IEAMSGRKTGVPGDIPTLGDASVVSPVQAFGPRKPNGVPCTFPISSCPLHNSFLIILLPSRPRARATLQGNRSVESAGNYPRDGTQGRRAVLAASIITRRWATSTATVLHIPPSPPTKQRCAC